MKKSEHVSTATSVNDADRPAPATPDGNPPSDRDAKGRYVKGNGGGPGNPFARRVAELRQVFYDCVTAADLEAIVVKVVEKALAGDLAAAKLLLQYLVGKPAAAVDPDTLDLHELDLYRQAPAPRVLGEVLAVQMPAEVACDIIRATLPYVAQSHADTFRDEMLKPVDPEDADDDDMDDDEVFARLQAAERAARDAKAQQAAAQPPLTNGSAGPARPAGNGSTANGTHDPSANGSKNGDDGQAGQRRGFPFGS